MSSSQTENSLPQSSSGDKPERIAQLFLPDRMNCIVYEHESRQFKAYAKDISGQLICFGQCEIGLEINPMTFVSDPVIADWIEKCWRYLAENTYRNFPLRTPVYMPN